MPVTDDREQYRRLIDQLVHSCQQGQGQIGPNRVRRGAWNREATAAGMRDQQKINDLLARLGPSERDVLAGMLFDAFVGGVHEALVVLHQNRVPPFEDGIEGAPFHTSLAGFTAGPGPQSDHRQPGRVADPNRRQAHAPGGHPRRRSARRGERVDTQGRMVVLAAVAA